MNGTAVIFLLSVSIFLVLTKTKKCFLDKRQEQYCGGHSRGMDIMESMYRIGLGQLEL